VAARKRLLAHPRSLAQPRSLRASRACVADLRDAGRAGLRDTSCAAWEPGELGVLELVERVHDPGVELATRQSVDLLDRLAERPGFLVGTCVGERVEDVDDGDDPGGQGDLLASQSVRVAASVPPLMV